MRCLAVGDPTLQAKALATRFLHDDVWCLELNTYRHFVAGTASAGM